MCMSKGAPTRPEVGPCHEQHNLMGDLMSMMLTVTIVNSVLNGLREVTKNGS